MRTVRYGDLILDEACLFAVRHGAKFTFTRNERALLLVLSRNPQRLLSRSHLLDQIEPEDHERSDRYIDFLVNRLRAKLGDDPRSPAFIRTQYGEGYIWIATPSPTKQEDDPVDAAIIIVVTADLSGPGDGGAAAFVAQVRDLIAERVSETGVAVAWNRKPNPRDRSRYMLHLNLANEAQRLAGAAIIREMPSRRIVRTLRISADADDARSTALMAERIAEAIDGALAQAISDAAIGLGIAPDDPLDLRIKATSTILLPADRRWLPGADDRMRPEIDGGDPDAALQHCLRLLARITEMRPFDALPREARDCIEDEIETLALACLPATEGNPLQMFAAAKLLYFVDRGHLDLVEDLVARAHARTGDSPAAYAVMGQLLYARGAFDAAVEIFDRGLRRTGLEPLFRLHLQVLKCLTLLAADDSGALATAIADTGPVPSFLPDLPLLMDLTFTPPERPLPVAAADALAAKGAPAAANAIEFLYFTSARHLVAASARANVMRGLVGRVRAVYGDKAVPAFLIADAGLSLAAGAPANRNAPRSANI